MPVSYCSVEGGSARQRFVPGVYAFCGRCEFYQKQAAAGGGRVRCATQAFPMGASWASTCRATTMSARAGATASACGRAGTAAAHGRMCAGCWKALRPYLWRVRCLRDGTLVVLASLYGTPWGPGRERATRNTMLPGETYQSKIQPFFSPAGMAASSARRITSCPVSAPMNLILWNCPTDGFSSSRETCRARLWGASSSRPLRTAG